MRGLTITAAMIMALIAAEHGATQETPKKKAEGPVAGKNLGSAEKITPLSLAEIEHYAKILDDEEFPVREAAHIALMKRVDSRLFQLLPYCVRNLTAEAKGRSTAILEPYFKERYEKKEPEESGWDAHWLWMENDEAKKNFVSPLDPKLRGADGFLETRARYLDKQKAHSHELLVQGLVPDPRWEKDSGDERHMFKMYRDDVKEMMTQRTLMQWTPDNDIALKQLQKENPGATVEELVLQIRGKDVDVEQRFRDHMQQFENGSNEYREKVQKTKPKYWNSPEKKKTDSRSELHRDGIGGDLQFVSTENTETVAQEKEPELTFKQIEKLAEELGDEDFPVRESAHAKLAKLPPNRVLYLLPAANSKDPEIKGRARELMRVHMTEIFKGIPLPQEAFKQWLWLDEKGKKEAKNFMHHRADGQALTFAQIEFPYRSHAESKGAQNSAASDYEAYQKALQAVAEEKREYEFWKAGNWTPDDQKALDEWRKDQPDGDIDAWKRERLTTKVGAIPSVVSKHIQPFVESSIRYRTQPKALPPNNFDPLPHESPIPEMFRRGPGMRLRGLIPLDDVRLDRNDRKNSIALASAKHTADAKRVLAQR
jgi:hypothetical protein